MEFFKIFKFISFIFAICTQIKNVKADSTSVNSIITVTPCCKAGLILIDGKCVVGNNGTTVTSSSNYSNYFEVSKHLLMPTFSSTISKLRFRLQTLVTSPECNSAQGTVLVSLQLSANENITEEHENSTLPTEKTFTPDGYFKYGVDYFSPEEYCVVSLQKELLVLSLCLPECNTQRPCITRCCEFGQLYDIDISKPGIQCVSSKDKQWKPAVYTNYYDKMSQFEMKKINFHYKSIHPREFCGEDVKFLSQRYYKSKERTLFRILKDGSVIRKNSRRQWSPMQNGTFCVEGAVNFPGTFTPYSGYENETIIIDCAEPKKMKQTSNYIIYGIAQAISSAFLLMILIVYGLLWEKQNIHGWTTLGYVISMFCFNMLSLAKYYSIYMHNSTSTSATPMLCKYLAIASHFFQMQIFTWLTMINFDIWWTFGNMKPTAGNSRRKRRFLMYTLFSIGIPAIFVGTGMTLDNIYWDDIESDIILPLYGKFKCSLEVEYAALPYLYWPIGLLLLCNAIFFAITVFSMYKIQQTTKMATSNSSHSPKHKKRTLLFLKLFLVMGVTWVLEITTKLWVGDNTTSPVVILCDMLNILQPIAVFVIFVCKADIWNSLRQKYPCIQRIVSHLSIKPSTAQRIVLRYPKLERVIGPMTRKEDARGKRCMSTSTELSHLSSTSVRQNPNTIQMQ